MAVGTVIRDPDVDFVGLARALGLREASRVEAAADLEEALVAAVAAVRGGSGPALVEVITHD